MESWWGGLGDHKAIPPDIFKWILGDLFPNNQKDALHTHSQPGLPALMLPTRIPWVSMEIHGFPWNVMTGGLGRAFHLEVVNNVGPKMVAGW